jgi:four helix bundle protein
LVALADELHSSVLTWSSFDKWALGIQLTRGADSIGANLAEAYGRTTQADRRRFVAIARGSALELEHWLERALARQLSCPSDALPRARELARMLTGMHRAFADAEADADAVGADADAEC